MVNAVTTNPVLYQHICNMASLDTIDKILSVHNFKSQNEYYLVNIDWLPVLDMNEQTDLFFPAAATSQSE